MSINNKFLYSLFLILVISNSCRSQRVGIKYTENPLVVSSSHSVLEDYFSKGIEVKNQILEESSHNLKKWNEITDSFHLSLIQVTNAKTEDDLLNFNLIYSQNFLKSRINVLQNNSISKWSAIHPNLEFFKSKQNVLAYVSLPIIDQTGVYAMFYVETESSGDLIVYKKGFDKSWEFYAMGTIWVE